MGTYTELVLKCQVITEKPQEVENVLRYMFCENYEIPSKLPDHILFKKECWTCIGKSGSFYHIPQATSFYDGTYLFTRCDFKNYHEEIETFLDWIQPYLSNEPWKYLGWIFYENQEEPTFIYKE